MTDELAYEFYKISELPEKSYYKSLAGCAIRGYKNTANQILKDKVNKDNIDLVIREYEDFMKPGTYWDKKGIEELTKEIYDNLKQIKIK